MAAPKDWVQARRVQPLTVAVDSNGATTPVAPAPRPETARERIDRMVQEQLDQAELDDLLARVQLRKAQRDLDLARAQRQLDRIRSGQQDGDEGGGPTRQQAQAIDTLQGVIGRLQTDLASASQANSELQSKVFQSYIDSQQTQLKMMEQRLAEATAGRGDPLQTFDQTLALVEQMSKRFEAIVPNRGPSPADLNLSRQQMIEQEKIRLESRIRQTMADTQLADVQARLEQARNESASRERNFDRGFEALKTIGGTALAGVVGDKLPAWLGGSSASEEAGGETTPQFAPTPPTLPCQRCGSPMPIDPARTSVVCPACGQYHQLRGPGQPAPNGAVEG